MLYLINYTKNYYFTKPNSSFGLSGFLYACPRGVSVKSKTVSHLAYIEFQDAQDIIKKN